MSGPSTVFVYGTLKPGYARWPHLAPFADEDPTPDAVEGILWRTPHGWPAATVGNRSIPGVVVALRPRKTADALALLDRIEGVDAGLFQRSIVTTEMGQPCWVYLWHHSTDR